MAEVVERQQARAHGVQPERPARTCRREIKRKWESDTGMSRTSRSLHLSGAFGSVLVSALPAAAFSTSRALPESLQPGKHEGTSQFWIRDGARTCAPTSHHPDPPQSIDHARAPATATMKLTDEQKERVRARRSVDILVREGRSLLPGRRRARRARARRCASRLTELKPIEEGVERRRRGARGRFPRLAKRARCCAPRHQPRHRHGQGAADSRKDPKWAAVESAFFEWAERLLDFMDSYHE